MRRWLVLGLLVCGLGAPLGVYAVTEARLARRYTVPAGSLSIPSDPEAVARGEHLITLAKCGECHGEDLGGKTIIDEPALATLSGPNLTPAGVLGDRSDTDIVQAIRYGLRPDGRPLMGMPTGEHFYFSDSELSAIIAALRALEPVARQTPPQRLGPLFRLLYLTDQIELIGAEEVDLSAPRPAAVSSSVSLAYGAHLARTGGCYSCHGEALAGGPMAGAPPTSLCTTRASAAGAGTTSRGPSARGCGRTEPRSTRRCRGATPAR